MLRFQHCFHFLQNNNITEVNTDTFCRSNDTYYLRPSLSEVRLDGNPVVLSKYPDSFTCMKVLPVGQYRWGGTTFSVVPPECPFHRWRKASRTDLTPQTSGEASTPLQQQSNLLFDFDLTLYYLDHWNNANCIEPSYFVPMSNRKAI